MVWLLSAAKAAAFEALKGRADALYVISEPLMNTNRVRHDRAVFPSPSEQDLAFEFFKRMPIAALENQSKASAPLDRIALSIAGALGRPHRALRRRLGGYRKEFLKK